MKSDDYKSGFIEKKLESNFTERKLNSGFIEKQLKDDKHFQFVFGIDERIKIADKFNIPVSKAFDYIYKTGKLPEKYNEFEEDKTIKNLLEEKFKSLKEKMMETVEVFKRLGDK